MTLFIIFSVGLYFFLAPKKTLVDIDAVKMKMSSIHKPKHTVKKASLPQASFVASREEEADSSSTDSSISFVSDDAIDPDDETETQATISNPEQAWQGELKDILVRLEPEDGEVIYNAYIAENENYQSEIEALSQEKNKGGRGVAGEFESIMGQVEKKHEDRLKELLGGHYEEVQQHHQEFMESAENTTL